MPDKSRETATENVDILDTYKQNMLRTVDEVSRYQPQYAQSYSNLQQDYLQMTKETITRSFAIQKSWYGNTRYPYIPATVPYAEQFKKQTDEATSQAFQVFNTANKLAIDSLDVARDNIKLYSKSFDTIAEYNANLADAWSNYFASAQKQYSK